MLMPMPVPVPLPPLPRSALVLLWGGLSATATATAAGGGGPAQPDDAPGAPKPYLMRRLVLGDGDHLADVAVVVEAEAIQLVLQAVACVGQHDGRADPRLVGVASALAAVVGAIRSIVVF